MTRVTMVTGLVLIVLGVGSYLGTGRESITAMIPAFFGAPILILGVLATQDRWRKVATHIAVALGLLGTLSIAGMLIPRALSDEGLSMTSALLVQVSMGVVCAIYVATCVVSFVKARKA